MSAMIPTLSPEEYRARVGGASARAAAVNALVRAGALEPCSGCGAEAFNVYTLPQLVRALRQEERLDANPTHLCSGREVTTWRTTAHAAPVR